jgi:TolA-binding protein
MNVATLVLLLAQAASPSFNQITSEVSKDTRIEILQAQHELDQVQNDVNNLRLQITQMQQQLDQRQQAAQQKYDKAINAAFNEAGRDRTKDDLDTKTFKFSPKPAKDKEKK